MIIRISITLVVIIGLLCFGWMGAKPITANDLLNNILNSFSIIANIIAVLGFLFALWNWESILRTIRGKNLGKSLDDVITGLIVIASDNETNYAPEWLIYNQKPHKLAIIYTSRSKPKAIKLYILAKELGIECVHEISEEYECRALDYTDIKNRVVRFVNILQSENIKKYEIFVDTTGGNVPMSIGAFQGAEAKSVSSIYTSAKKDDKGKDLYITADTYTDNKMASIIFMSNWSRYNA